MSEKKMRILVISDSHGRNDDVAGVIEQVGHIDMLIHCGDVERGDDYIRSLVDCPVHMVSGNNDYNLDLPAQDIFNIGDYKVLVVHGHTFCVYRGVERLKQYALQNHIDIVMFGHTHKPYIEIDEDVTILNPEAFLTQDNLIICQHFSLWKSMMKARHITDTDIINRNLAN